MSEPTTQSLSPPWLNQLAPDALLISSVLNRPLQGRDAIIKVVQTAGGLYESHSVVFQGTLGERELVEYDARAFGGSNLHGVLTLSRNPTGDIIEVGIHHGPLGAVNRLSAALKETLATEIGVDYFLP